MSGVVERDRIAKHFGALQEAVDGLRARSGSTVDDLERDRDLRWIVCHGLLLAVSNVLDVGTHICTSLGKAPDQYRDIGPNLVNLGVLDFGLGERIAAMAGFRNVLVHGYIALNLALVVDALQELDDFPAFALAVTKFLDANPDL